MIEGLIITALGGIARVQIDDSNGSGLEDMQRVVGGWIEPVDYEIGGAQVSAYHNEEGKLLGLPKNDLATHLAAGRLFSNDYIAGDVLIVGVPDDVEGRTQSIPDAARDAILAKAPSFR